MYPSYFSINKQEHLYELGSGKSATAKGYSGTDGYFSQNNEGKS